MSRSSRAAIAAETLLMGADGVMVPFRPQAKTAAGKTAWREVKVAIFARLGKHITRAGQTISRLHHHRVTAVLGDVDDLSERMWLEALKQDIKQAPRVVWLSDGGRGFGGYSCGSGLTRLARIRTTSLDQTVQLSR